MTRLTPPRPIRHKVILKKIVPAFTSKESVERSVHIIATMEADPEGSWVPFAEIERAVQKRFDKINNFLIG